MTTAISPETSYKLRQLLWITLYWVGMTRIVVTLEYYGVDEVPVFLFEQDLFAVLQQNMIAATLSGLMIGLLTGLGELFLFPRYFINKSFIRLILSKLIVYFVCIFLVSGTAAYLYLSGFRGYGHLEAARSVLDLFNTNGYYHLLVIGMLLSLGINFILIMQNKIGHGTFSAILLGRYHKPREEERIFLFVDLKSSTRTAEQLGHVDYSSLLQQCFRDLAGEVVRCRGTIYQFVGDEVVVTWKSRHRTNYANSIRLFFGFRELLNSQGEKYRSRFGVVPSFKGAVHAGRVMVAEVGGNLKSEIAYHGDVLNTASRMMELCNFYRKDLVISGEVARHLLPGECDVDIRLEGEIRLRGKERTMSLFSVEEREKVAEIGDEHLRGSQP